jgi:uncharacterized lipoprotein YajG
MQHEALTDQEQRKKVLSLFAAIILAACDTRPMHIISTALKTGAPQHMIDTQLPNLWRY